MFKIIDVTVTNLFEFALTLEETGDRKATRHDSSQLYEIIPNRAKTPSIQFSDHFESLSLVVFLDEIC